MVPRGIILVLTCEDRPWPISQQLLDILPAVLCGYYLHMRQRLREVEQLFQAHTAGKLQNLFSVASSVRLQGPGTHSPPR